MEGPKEASGIGIAGETPNSTQFLTESVNVQETDFKMMEILSGLGDEQWSRRILSGLQNLVDQLREDFANELEERDTVVRLYKNLWRESEAALASIKCEMKHIKAELEALKQRQFHKDAPDLSVGECETSENRGRANCLCSLESSLSPKESIMNQEAIQLSHVKDAEGPDTKPNLNSLMNVTAQTHAKETFSEWAAISFSRDKSLGEGDTSDNLGRTNCKNTLETTLNLKEEMMGESAVLLSQGRNCEELDSKSNLNSPVNVASQIFAEGTILERASILFSRDKSLGEGETSENRGYKNSLEFKLNPYENIMDKGAMLLSLGKDHIDFDTKTNLNSPVSATPEAHAKGTFGEQAATVSQDKSPVDGEISENWGRANCQTSLEINLNPKQNIVGEGAMVLSQGTDHKDLDTKTNLSSPMNVTPQTYAEETVLERAAILFSRDRSCGDGETSENKGGANCTNPEGVNLNPLEETQDISKSAYDTEEVSNSHLRPKIPSTFHNHNDLDTKTNLSSPGSLTPQALAEGPFLERAAILFSRDRSFGEGEASENRGRANCKDPWEVNLNPKENMADEGAMLLSQGKDHKDLYTKSNLNSPVNVTPRAHTSGTIFERAAILFSLDKNLREGEISRNWGRANCKTSLEINLNPNKNIMGEGSMLLSQEDCKDLDTKTNLSSQVNVTIQTHAEETVLERAAILFSRNRSLGEAQTSENNDGANCKNPQGVNLNPLEETQDISKSACGTEEFSNSYLRPKIPSTFCMEQFRALVPEADHSSKEDESIRTLHLKGQLESSSSVMSDDLVCSQSQCFYHGVQLEESSFDSDLMKLIDVSTSENIMDKSAMLLSLGKDHEDLNSPVSVMPEAHAKRTFWEQATTVSQDKSLLDGEISENWGRANCITSLETNLISKENITREGTMLLSQGSNHNDLDTKTNLSSRGSLTPQAHAEGPFLERAAILFSRDRSLGEGEASENRGRANCKDPWEVNLNPKENMADECAMLLSQGKDHKDLYTKSNSNSPVNVTPRAHTSGTIFERAAILFSRDKNLREGEISRNLGRANCKTSLEINLNPKQNIMGEGAMLLSQGKDHKDLDTMTNLSSPVNVTSQTHAEGTILERVAILFSRDRSLGEDETSKNKGRANCKDPPGFNLNPPEKTRDIIKSAYDTGEFSNSDLRPKIPSAFCMGQFLDLVPQTDCSSKEDELTGTLGLKGQLESSSSVLSDDLVCSQSQCSYHGVQLEKSNFDSDLTKLTDASYPENSSKKRKCGMLLLYGI